MVVDAGWVVGIYGYQQFLRIAQNIGLAHLLSPAVFGLMSLITALRTGIELLTDLGVGQSIVVAEQGESRSFINTAWSIQAVRGALLTLIAIALAWPLGAWYGKAEITPVFAVMSFLFVIGGLSYPARALMQRRRLIKKTAFYEAAISSAGVVVTIIPAFLLPSIWGLAIGALLSAAIAMGASFLVLPIKGLKFAIDPDDAIKIRSFGKWIYVSSLVYFISGNFDRLFLPTQISLTLLGVYGIARTLADSATQLVQRLSVMIIFPTVAQFGDRLIEQADRIRRLRQRGLFAASVGLGLLTAASDIFIELCYDDRYLAAAVLAPMLLIGAWFSVQAATCEAVLLGLSQPYRTAQGNVVKLLWVVVTLPIAFHAGGLLVGLIVISFNDVPRYLWLSYHQRRAGFHFAAQDVASFVMFVVATVAVRGLLLATGVIPALVTPNQLAGLTAFR